MIAENLSNVRNNFNEVCNRIIQDSDIAVITRENAENVVIMSQSQYENMMENLYIRNSKSNYEWLKDSIKQAEEGNLIEFNPEENNGEFFKFPVGKI